MMNFDELDAMKKIAAALDPLGDDARQRALQWANSRFGATKKFGITETGVQPSTGHYSSFAELFNAATPVSESEKALIAAFWLQTCNGAPNFQAQSLNDELKNLGHRVGNITEALNQLKNEKPALVLQLKKSGTTKQARKIYKLTLEGTKHASAMLKGSVKPVADEE